MSRLPLEKTVLNVKLLLSDFGTVSELLAATLSPPPPLRVEDAFRELCRFGATTREDESGIVTKLGELCVHMPIDIPHVQLILLGRQFGCVCDALVVASALTVNDIFQQPSRIFIRDSRMFEKELERVFFRRCKHDAGQFSDPLCLLDVYKAWLASGKKAVDAFKLGISIVRVKQLDSLVSELCRSVARLLYHKKSKSDAHQIALLEKLDDAARCRSGMPRSAIPDLCGLFSRDTWLCKFVIAGACARHVIVGQVKSKSPALIECDRLGIRPYRCVVLSGCTPKEAANEATIKSGLKAVGVAADAVHRWQGCRFIVLLALTKSENEGGPARGCERDLCYNGKLLFQIYRQTRGPNGKQAALVLPNASAKPGSGLPDDMVFTGVVPCAKEINWSHVDTGVKAIASKTSVFNTMCDCSDRADHRVAVAMGIMGILGGNSVFTEGMTVLPAGNFGKVVQLIFALKESKVAHPLASARCRCQAS